MPFLGAFGAAWDDALIAHWSAHPPGMLWPQTDAGLAPGWRKRRAAGGNQAADGFFFQRDVQAGLGFGSRGRLQGHVRTSGRTAPLAASDAGR